MSEAMGSCPNCGNAYNEGYEHGSEVAVGFFRERDELRAALRDLRAYTVSVETVALMRSGYERPDVPALRAHIDALIGPYDPHSVTRPASL